MPAIDLHPAAENLNALISSVADGDLGRPTPCSEYTVGDLLDHIAGLTVAFAGAAAKANGPTSTMGPSGDAANLDTDWRSSLPLRVKALAEAWRDPDAWEGMTRVGGQDLPGDVAGIVAFGELTVHGWDLARATGLPFHVDAAGLSALHQLVRQTFGAPDAPPGPAFKPPVPAPADAPLLDQTVALLGRDPGWSA